MIKEYASQQRPEMNADRLYGDTNWGQDQWESISHLYDWISPSNEWIKKKGYRRIQAMVAKDRS